MATDELDILADTTNEDTGLEDTTSDSSSQAQSTILEDFYAQVGQTITGPRGREVLVTEDMLRQQLQGEFIAAQNFNYVPYGSIDPDDYETDQYGNVILEVDEFGRRIGASGDALGFSFSDKDAANKLFGGQADQVESVIRDYNSQIYALTSGAAELGFTLPEADQQRLRQQAQEMYPDASEAELQYIYKELVKNELGIDDFQAEKVRLSEERNSVLAEYGIDIATMGERAGPQQTLVGTYELREGDTTYTINATTGEITTYTKPTTGAYVKGFITAAAASMLAGPLATALGPTSAGGAGLFSSAAAAKAASSAIISSASQLATTGKVDFGQALVSAAISYGGSQLGDAIKNNSAVGDIVSQVQSTTDTAVDFLSQGNSLAEAAIRAGGMSMLTQLVTTGEVDMTQAAIAAVISGGVEAVQQLATTSGQPVDEFMADLQEQDEFVQAAIDADIKDPFLNPNYTTVGDGLMVNAAGNVFNYAGDNLGNMSTLDTNNDGMLSGVDLQEITTDVEAKNIYNYQMGDTVYVDENGVAVDPKLVKRSGDGFVGYDAAGNEVTVTEKYYDEVFGGGKGDLIWTSEGGTDGYISYETGELAYKKVATTQTLYDAEGNPYESEVTQWIDAEGNVVEDPQTVDELTMIAAKAIDEPLESVTYFDQSGTAINYKYPPAGLQDNFEQGQFSGLIFGPNGEINEVWYDPVTNTEYVKAQGTTEITAIRTPDTPPEPVDPTEVTEVTKTTPAGGIETADNTADAISTATDTNQINEIVTAASQQGASASQLTNAINAALAAGAISTEQAAAALGAIDVTASVDPSTTSVSTGAGGMLTGGAGADVDTVTTGDVTAGSGAGTDVTGGGNGTDVTGGGDSGVTTGDGGAADTGTGTGKNTGPSVTDTITGALGGAITTVAGTGDPGTGDPGTGDPGTGGPGTGGPPGIDGKDGKDGRDGVSSRPFTPYEFKGLSYQTPTIQEIVQNPNIDYTASLDRIINQGMFGNLI